MKNTTITTYYNRNDKPIIRRCNNCVFWKPLSNYDNQKTNPEVEAGLDPETLKSLENNKDYHLVGCCTNRPLLFAPSMEESRYALSKPFDLCADHQLQNEAILAKNGAKKVLQSDVVTPKGA